MVASRLNDFLFLVISLQVPRKLNLNLEVVDQLFFLSVAPPVTATDIPKVLEELQEKKASPL